MSTLIIGSIIAAAVGLACYTMAMDRKAAKEQGCSGTCAGCPHARKCV